MRSNYVRAGLIFGKRTCLFSPPASPPPSPNHGFAAQLVLREAAEQLPNGGVKQGGEGGRNCLQRGESREGVSKN